MPAAGAGEGEAGEQDQPHRDRRRREEQAALRGHVEPRLAKRPPAPGEGDCQRDLQIQGEMVGVDERAAQTGRVAGHAHSPDLGRSGNPAPGAVEHLEQGCREDRRAQPAAAVPAPACYRGGDQHGRDRGPGQRGPARGIRSQRQRRRPIDSGNSRRQGGMAGGEHGGERPRPGEGLQHAEHGDHRQGRGRRGHGLEVARPGRQSRQGQRGESDRLDDRRTPARDARERQGRPEQQKGQDHRDRGPEMTYDPAVIHTAILIPASLEAECAPDR